MPVLLRRRGSALQAQCALGSSLSNVDPLLTLFALIVECPGCSTGFCKACTKQQAEIQIGMRKFVRLVRPAHHLAKPL